MSFTAFNQESLQRDTLDAIYCYRSELDAVVLRLTTVERQNRVMILIVVATILLFAAIIYTVVVRSRKRLKTARLSTRILSQSATVLPKFTSQVNTLSGKSLKLSTELYEAFQDAIDKMKEEQKRGLSVIVGDDAFQAQYPYLSDYPMLSVQEQLVLILFEEEFKTGEIATLMGISPNSVRAIKTRIKSKLMQSGSNSRRRSFKIFNEQKQ